MKDENSKEQTDYRDSPQHPAYKKRRVYGRRLGKPLRGGRADAIDTQLPSLSIPAQFLTESGDINPSDLFQSPVTRLHFEIGFGNGEHLKHVMETEPQDHFIGAEPFINGMSAFLKSIQDMPHHHIRVHMDDALMALNSLEPQSVDFIYILNPDPWPKSRHHKRRMVNPDNVKAFARALKSGGTMIQTTDIDELAEWMEEHTLQHPAFKLVSRDAPSGWMATRYEEKGRLAGRQQSYLTYKKI